jgi:hypothetical protein
MQQAARRGFMVATDMTACCCSAATSATVDVPLADIASAPTSSIHNYCLHSHNMSAAPCDDVSVGLTPGTHPHVMTRKMMKMMMVMIMIMMTGL